MVGQTHLRLVADSSDGAQAAWLAALSAQLSDSEVGIVRGALEWVTPRIAGNNLGSGEPMLAHAVAAATILQGLKLDGESLAAALLMHVADAREAALEMRTRFGVRVADLAEGAVRMATIEHLGSRAAHHGPDDHGAQLESLRKMLLAMAQDVRVVLVKLADHMQTLRYAAKSGDAALQGRVGRLALDIFAPLANRLGVWQLKWEIEDLALRVLEPQDYKRIAALLDEKRVDRERYIDKVIGGLTDELGKAGVQCEVTGRPKHIYSIYTKMSRKGVSFDALYDVRAVRVMVADIKGCYTALGVAHNLWTPLPKEFDDYIAKPKPNGYRSLHTAVMGPEGKPVEIQIRTLEMHRHAELGVAAHWRYKEGGGGQDEKYADKISWLRQVVDWREQVADTADFAEQFKSEVFEDTIYVLTPQGKVIDLPKEATPIDFAYRLHSDVGHHCRGAKVDGVMVPLNTPLRNGQWVEILTAKQGGPSRDWLNAALGYAKSHNARVKVRQWFNRQNYEAAVSQGRDVLEKELRRHGATGTNLDKLAREFDFDKLDDFLAALGRNEIGSRQLESVLRAETQAPPVVEEPSLVGKARAQPQASGVLVVGVDKLLTVPAKCCKPAPPDPIVGFVTRGRGVTVHRKSCANVARLAAERLVAADWGRSAGGMFPVDIVIEAADRSGLLRDIGETLARERINVTGTQSASRDQSVHMVITVEVAHLEQLARVLALLRDVRGVARAARR